MMHGTGYGTLLTAMLPKGSQIVTPRPVWSMFGRPGGGVETRVYGPVTPDTNLLARKVTFSPMKSHGFTF